MTPLPPGVAVALATFRACTGSADTFQSSAAQLCLHGHMKLFGNIYKITSYFSSRYAYDHNSGMLHKDTFNYCQLIAYLIQMTIKKKNFKGDGGIPNNIQNDTNIKGK